MEKKILYQSQVTAGFWKEIQTVNSRQAIFHQWEQLKKSGCIENFRVCAGQSYAPRTGLFFADSDAYKWLDAACRILRRNDLPELWSRVDDLAELILAAMAADGYIYTYNQILFPDCRWKNMQIEHELYCMGHLIEAGIAHQRLGHGKALFEGILKTADLICQDFWNSDWKNVDGHEEIEIALLKLADETGQAKYRDMASHFLEHRKVGRGFVFHFLRQAFNSVTRMSLAEKARQDDLAKQPGRGEFVLPARNHHRTPWSVWPRLVFSLLSAKFSQRNENLNESTEPVGHAVRFAYLETAAAMLARQNGENTLNAGMERKWERMVSKRMYVTGGIGSLPLIEGFGRDFELDPQTAYNETCAALGSVFWNRQMALLTGDARYDDLLEWQLYNAVLVGFAKDGCAYFYNNPLISAEHVHRAPWYDVPCCPSNISRTWADLGDYIYSATKNKITIHQYISTEAKLGEDESIRIHMVSGLPWEGKIQFRLEMRQDTPLVLRLRYPAWADGFDLCLNGKSVMTGEATPEKTGIITASGIALGGRDFIKVNRTFTDGDTFELIFGMPLKILRQDARIRSCRGMAALARGPIVYCLEDCDNPGIPLPPEIDSNSFTLVEGNGFFQGIPLVEAIYQEGKTVRFIPYFLWGNRRKSNMSVFFIPRD